MLKQNITSVGQGQPGPQPQNRSLLCCPVQTLLTVNSEMNQNKTELIFNIDKPVMIIFGLIFFGCGLIASLLLPIFVPGLISIWFIWAPVIVGYTIFFGYFVSVWRQRENYVVLNDGTISLHSPETQIVKIRWNDIIDVKENNILERLKIKDINGQILNLEYQLKGMTDLLNLISNSIPQLTMEFSKLRKFRRTNHLHIFFSVFIVFISALSIYSWLSGATSQAIVLSVFSLCIIYVLLTEFINVRILDDGVAISYPLHKKEIKYSQIKTIAIEKIRSGNGKSSPFVIIKLLNEKTIKLNALREGTIALFSAMNSSFSKPSHSNVNSAKKARS